MTEASTKQTSAPSPPLFQHYACYRTQPLGWQEAGYVIVTTVAASAGDLPTTTNNPYLWENTTWVADPDHKYQMSHVYPELASGSTNNIP